MISLASFAVACASTGPATLSSHAPGRSKGFKNSNCFAWIVRLTSIVSGVSNKSAP